MTRVLPVAGRAVYLPNTRPPLPVPAEGVDVVLDAFWLRRLRDGDVRLATTGAQTGTSGGTTPGGSTTGGSTTGGTTAGGVDQTARTAAAAAQAKADAAIPAIQKGAAGGVATLGQDGRVPAGQLPPAAAGVEEGVDPGALPSAASAPNLVGVGPDGSLVRVPPSALGGTDGAPPGDLPSAASASNLVGVASDGSLVRVPPLPDGEIPDALPSAIVAPELVGIDLDGALVRLITPALAGPLASLPVASVLGDADQVPVYQGGRWKRVAGSILRAAGGTTGTSSDQAPATAAGALALDGAGWDGKVRGTYSTRKLRSAYAGPCVRVRPQGGAEFDVGFTSAGLLDTTALGGGTVFLVRWYDQSGAGRDFIQTDPARQHVLVENGTAFAFGGRPAIRCNPFDGAWMSAPSVPVTNALCAAMVAKGVAGTPYGEQGNLLIYDAGAAGVTVACTPSDKTRLAAYYADGFRDYPAGDPTASGGPLGPTGFTARARVAPGGIALSFNGTTGETFVSPEGATLAVGSGVGATGTLHFGGQPDGGQGKSWEGLASEIVLGDGVADADLAALDADQRAFFGIV